MPTPDDLSAARERLEAYLRDVDMRWGKLAHADIRTILAALDEAQAEATRIKNECDSGTCPSAQHERLAASKLVPMADMKALKAEVSWLRAANEGHVIGAAKDKAKLAVLRAECREWRAWDWQGRLGLPDRLDAAFAATNEQGALDD